MLENIKYRSVLSYSMTFNTDIKKNTLLLKVSLNTNDKKKSVDYMYL